MKTQNIHRTNGKNGGDDVASAFQFNAAIMKMVFGISEREVLKADVAEQLAAAKMIHFVMQDIITQKFLELNPNRPEESKEKSAFDEYDEENGYNEAEINLTMKISGKYAATMWTGL